MDPRLTPTMARRVGRLLHLRERRPGCDEWDVELDGEPALALAFPELTGPLQPGDSVLLNTTAVELGLGTGGAHIVLARLDPSEAAPAAFQGRDAGHVLKLRYTPLQLRVCAVEDEASPHRERICSSGGLHGTPVLGAELHSQAGAAAIAASAARPGLRIALVLLDTAALPIALSRMIARLRRDSILTGTVTSGQAFGGDLEAVNVYTALIAAREVLRADLILVTQGPGNVGTGTEYGFSGLGLVEAFHAAAHLGGRPVLAPRMSAADPRPRHRGLSHHTQTVLRCTRVPVYVPVPTAAPRLRNDAQEALAAHHLHRIDPQPVMNALEPYREEIRSMGRDLDQDPLFYRAAAAAGLYCAVLMASRQEAP